MKFQILGPVGLRLPNGTLLTFGSDKERLILAALALDAGRPVAINELMERLWDDNPPAHARENTHTYVSRIRKQLREAFKGLAVPPLTGKAHTYTLLTAPDGVDLHRFRRLVDVASASEGDERKVELITEAEGLWQGEALAGLPGLWAANVRLTLAEARLSATTARVAAALRIGRFAQQIGELSALVRANPHDELLASQLMLAYYGSGRYTEALRVHQRARQALMAEYGALPGAELSAVHQGVLARVPARELARDGGDTGRTAAAPAGSATTATARTAATGAAPAGAAPVVTTEAAVTASPTRAVPAPRNLPQQPSLVGRQPELRALTSLIADRDSRGGPVVTVEAVSGMAGVGKTALAVTTAHLLAGQYPDGQLYIDLRGHSPAQEPLTARAALATLLRLVGAPAFSIPAELEARTALWRTMLAQRRVVVVLDDASGPEQIAPLLPSGSPSLTIIASRRHLTGVPHALSVALDVLPEEDAITLFRSFAGEERTRDSTQVARIVRLCGCLPLAIELVAHRFRARASWTLGVLAGRLAESPARLAEIRSADQEQEMTRAFALSYRALTAPQRMAFRRLGLHPGHDFPAPAAAALLGLPLDATERLLESLLASHLLREPVPDRYRYHDLLREYARGLSAAEDSERDRDQALARLKDFYVTTADLADRTAYPRRLRPDSRPPLPQDHRSQAPFPGPAAARSWLSAERGNLLAVEEHARREGDPATAAGLAGILAGFLQSECHWQDAVRLLRHAVVHWDRTRDDAPALCRALIDLCAAEASIGEYPEAAAAGERALELARARGDGPAEAEALSALGTLNWHLGEYRTALVLLQKSRAIKSLSGDVWDKARSRNNIAVTLLFLGEHDRALAHFREALSGFREAGDRIASGQTLNNMGDLQMRAGDLNAARRSFREALAFLEAEGSRYDRATARRNLAQVLADSGAPAVALPIFEETLAEFRALGDRKSQAEALVGIGEAYWRLGSPKESHRRLNEALELAQDIGTAHQEVQALRLLGRADFAAGRLAAATDRLRAAAAIAARTHAAVEEAAARVLLAEVRLAAGDTSEARSTLRQAFELMRSRDDAEAARIGRRLAEVEQVSDNGTGSGIAVTLGE
ncbi:AfsR/SARP family transcriptional regulator [Streptomyces sp. CA-253872]|uniref:AfsR/SARP family transcriptional regulator n=1 Tax=Streptomyces sp. CA-253872 TaxID=3240067 RepID=UPI003D90C8DB